MKLALFITNFSKGEWKKKYTGIEGMNDFCRQYNHDFNIIQFKNKPDFTFKGWYEAGSIVLVVHSFNLIEKRIQISNLSNDMKQLFSDKLNTYYSAKLQMPFDHLSAAFAKYPHQKDDFTETIQQLVKKQTENKRA